VSAAATVLASHGDVVLIADNETTEVHLIDGADGRTILTPAELRWLALIGAAQAYRLLPESVRAEAEGQIASERPVTNGAPESAPAEDGPEAQEAQAMLDEPLFQT
jgi:hypothetical protein